MAEVKTTFEIPEENMAMLSHKIEVLNRKAARLNCPVIETRVLASARRMDFIPIMGEETNVIIDHVAVSRVYFTVEILGISPILPDWEFLGTLEHLDAGNVIRSVPGIEMPINYRTGPQKCDHCQKTRRRKKTYIVRNKVTDAIQQVGHDCLKDFLGHASPQAIALFAEFLKEMEHYHEPTWGGGKRPSLALESFLKVAAQCVLQFGFISKTASMAYADKSEGAGYLQTTAAKAWEYCFPPKEKHRNSDTLTVTENAIQLVEDVTEWVAGLAGVTNYEHNLKLLFQKPYIKRQDINFIASAIGAYQKSQGEVRTKKMAKLSEHFGTIGKRETFKLKYIKTYVWGEGFAGGTYYMHQFQDAQGNVAIWKTGIAIEPAVEENGFYSITATVKAHSLYKDLKQTVLTRAVVKAKVEET